MIGFSSFRPLRRIICVWRWICAATACRTSRRAATRWGCSPLMWPRLIHALDLAPAHIVGLSLGGMVAQQLAVAHRQVVRSLVLINTLPGLWPPPRQIVRMGLRRFTPPWRSPDMLACGRARLGRSFPRSGAALTARRRRSDGMAANDPQAYRRATLAVASFWPGPALKRIACPTLIIAGDADRVVPGIYQARSAQGAAPCPVRLRAGRGSRLQHRPRGSGQRGSSRVSEPCLSWINLLT